MRKLFFLAVMLVSSLAALAEDGVTAKVATSQDLKEATVSVFLTNDVQYVAFQMDIVFPTSMKLSASEPVPTGRLVDESGNVVNFTIAYQMVNDYTLRVLAYNMDNRAIAGTSGTCLFTVTLTDQNATAAAATASDWTPSLNQNLFVKNTDALPEVNLTETSNVVNGYVAGDVVPNGEIDVNDIVGLIAIIYGKDTTGLNVDAADVNNDSAYDVNDIVGIISLIYK
ncbi:MAG: hypothetical protein IJL35_13580 [Bacteroidaceae bacterium]|nr:hypothetical protein [Bacteroidaceae bacterium]